MLRLLQQLNYTPPHIVEYNNNNTVVTRGEPHIWQLQVHGHQWMSYDTILHTEIYQLYSHYDLADGHCICTGLGFGSREQWLLTRPNVTKVTVLEKNKEVIEYHQHIKSPFLDHIEIIHTDAAEYKGSCDTLLLDHYQFEPFSKKRASLIRNIKQCSTNIQHNVLWFWPLEALITKSSLVPHLDTYDQYQFLRNSLPTLPDLDIHTIRLYIMMYYMNIVTQ